MLSVDVFGVCCCLLTILSASSGLTDRSKISKRQNFYYGGPSDVHILQRPLRQKEKEEQQDLTKIPGAPGIDYPTYRSVPETNFNCAQVPATPGMYADVETGCQAYRVCNDGRDGHQGASFLCTNGTLFNQKEFTCDWWYNVNCNDAPYYYNLNADPIKNPYAPKPKPIEPALPLDEYHHRPTYAYQQAPQPIYQPQPHFVAAPAPQPHFAPAPQPHFVPTPQPHYQPRPISQPHYQPYPPQPQYTKRQTSPRGQRQYEPQNFYLSYPKQPTRGQRQTSSVSRRPKHVHVSEK